MCSKSRNPARIRPVETLRVDAGMSAARAFTLRMPRAWIGRVDSQSVRRWLRDWCAHPTPQLPADPGAGHYRASFTLSKRELRVASGLLDASESEAVRRIVAARISSFSPANSSFALPAPRDCQLPRSRVVRLPSRPVPAWRRVPDCGGWIPQRSLEASAVPVSQTRRGATSDPTALSESWGLLEWATLVGMGILAIWGFAVLFRVSSKPIVPAAGAVNPLRGISSI